MARKDHNFGSKSAQSKAKSAARKAAAQSRVDKRIASDHTPHSDGRGQSGQQNRR